MQILDDSPFSITAAALALQEGELVVFQTETVYGLGADATSDRAVASIFATKGRPSFNPLIVHVSEPDQVAGFAQIVDHAAALMEHFWPGPLTLVLPRSADSPISLLCSAGLSSLAIRCPSHPTARALIDASGLPLAAPSANRSGKISPTSARHVIDSFGADNGDIAFLLDGKRPCAIGLESTVLDLTSTTPTLLRPGAILREEIEELLGVNVLTSHGNAAKPNAPGQLASHYAPRLRVRLNVTEPEDGEAYIGFGSPTRKQGREQECKQECKQERKHGHEQIHGEIHGAMSGEAPSPSCHATLSPTGDLHEAAANLFATLWAFDVPARYSGIAIAPIPEEGLGIAINDRLRRAAAER